MSRLLLSYSFFFFNDTATTEIYTLSLHDALPILRYPHQYLCFPRQDTCQLTSQYLHPGEAQAYPAHLVQVSKLSQLYHLSSNLRSEEHTSELQSHLNLVCRLLLEKKKNKNKHTTQ